MGTREILSPAARASISYIEALAAGKKNRDLLQIAEHDKVNPFEVRRRLNLALRVYREEVKKDAAGKINV